MHIDIKEAWPQSHAVPEKNMSIHNNNDQYLAAGLRNPEKQVGFTCFVAFAYNSSREMGSFIIALATFIISFEVNPSSFM